MDSESVSPVQSEAEKAPEVTASDQSTLSVVRTPIAVPPGARANIPYRLARDQRLVDVLPGEGAVVSGIRVGSFTFVRGEGQSWSDALGKSARFREGTGIVFVLENAGKDARIVEARLQLVDEVFSEESAPGTVNASSASAPNAPGAVKERFVRHTVGPQPGGVGPIGSGAPNARGPIREVRATIGPQGTQPARQRQRSYADQNTARVANGGRRVVTPTRGMTGRTTTGGERVARANGSARPEDRVNAAPRASQERASVPGAAGLGTGFRMPDPARAAAAAEKGTPTSRANDGQEMILAMPPDPNEKAVLLPKGPTLRLLGMLKNNAPMYAPYKPMIVRYLTLAMTRQGAVSWGTNEVVAYLRVEHVAEIGRLLRKGARPSSAEMKADIVQRLEEGFERDRARTAERRNNNNERAA